MIDGQADLEARLTATSEFVAAEDRMRPLAVRVSAALRSAGSLAPHADAVRNNCCGERLNRLLHRAVC